MNLFRPRPLNRGYRATGNGGPVWTRDTSTRNYHEGESDQLKLENPLGCLDDPVFTHRAGREWTRLSRGDDEAGC